jgi:hypothetical protein
MYHPKASINSIPVDEITRQAHIRRSDRLLSWLYRPDYAVFTGEHSIARLSKLINVITRVLETSLPEKEWHIFQRKVKKARQLLSAYSGDETIIEKDEKADYQLAILLMLATLESYKAFIQNNGKSIN